MSSMKMFFALCIIIAFIPKALSNHTITKEEVRIALENWSTGLLSIAAAKNKNKNSTLEIATIAEDFIDLAYNYQAGDVLFKPTVTIDIPFRTTKDGALSYFVGGDPSFPEDKGFALSYWTSVKHEIFGFSNRTDSALVQTRTTITKSDGSSVAPYFSMGFVRDSTTNELKIDLHHSSLPYAAAVPSITEDEVKKALTNWGKGLVSISDAKANGLDYVAAATKMINDAYNYQNGIVLFKPTVAVEVPFRTTFTGALSYFVGGNSAYPEDKGFALSPYKSVSYLIEGIVYDGKRAIMQAKMTLTKSDGSSVHPYFSMGFVKDASGNLKIDLHHSSLPPTSATSAKDAEEKEEESVNIASRTSVAAIVLACFSFAAIALMIAYITKNGRKQAESRELPGSIEHTSTSV